MSSQSAPRSSLPSDSRCSGKVIALVEWNAAGHHQTFFRAFSAALLIEGATVIPICPWEKTEIKSLVEIFLSPGDKQVIDRFEEPVLCKWPPSGGGRLAKMRERFDRNRHFRRVSKNLQDWERRSGKKVDLVFFCCIYDPQFADFPGAAQHLRWPWSGLYFDSRFVRKPGSLRPYSLTPARPDKIFSGRGLHSLAILDEGIVDQMRDLTGGRPVIWFPDIADTRVASPDQSGGTLGSKIRGFAAGRKIVGCLGHLQKTKGLLELVRAGNDPRLEDVFFVFIGEANLFGIPSEEQAEITAAWEHCPRIFCHPLQVAEPTYNSAFEACDVIAAAYSDFPNSSNTLTKAAYFSKPVVVNDGYLMAERVREFNLGVVVSEGSQEELSSALVALISGADTWKAEDARWGDYSEMHSQGRLRESFRELVVGCL